jgi:hypothetical protein
LSGLAVAVGVELALRDQLDLLVQPARLVLLGPTVQPEPQARPGQLALRVPLDQLALLEQLVLLDRQALLVLLGLQEQPEHQGQQERLEQRARLVLVLLVRPARLAQRAQLDPLVLLVLQVLVQQDRLAPLEPPDQRAPQVQQEPLDQSVRPALPGLREPPVQQGRQAQLVLLVL